MKNNKNPEKTAYLLLRISTIISVILIALVIFMVVASFIIGPQDPNGGGWIIFYALLIAFVLFPFLILGTLHCIFYFVSFSKYKKNSPKAHKLAVTCAVLGILASLCFLGFTFTILFILAVLVIPYVACPIAALVFLNKSTKNVEFSPTLQ